MFQFYFRINKEHDHILLVDNKKVTETTGKGILEYLLLTWH